MGVAHPEIARKAGEPCSEVRYLGALSIIALQKWSGDGSDRWALEGYGDSPTQPLDGNPAGLGPDPAPASTGPEHTLQVLCFLTLQEGDKVELQAHPFTRSFSHISYICHSYNASLKPLLSTWEPPDPWFHHPRILYSDICINIWVNEHKTGSSVRLETITIDKEEKDNVKILCNLKTLEGYVQTLFKKAAHADK